MNEFSLQFWEMPKNRIEYGYIPEYEYGYIPDTVFDLLSDSADFNLLMNENIFKPCRRVPGESKLRFDSISRQLYRLRDKQYPKRPSTDEELKKAFANENIFAEYGHTLDKRRPFYAGSKIKKNRYAFHVFASFGIIDLVRKHIPPNQRKYLLDGTFKIVPRQFRQLLIIAIEYKNDVSIPKIIPICCTYPMDE